METRNAALWALRSRSAQHDAKGLRFSACERGLKKDRAHLRAKVLASHFCHAYSAAERRSEIYSPACSSNKSFGFCCAKIADATTPFGNHQKTAQQTNFAGSQRVLNPLVSFLRHSLRQGKEWHLLSPSARQQGEAVGVVVKTIAFPLLPVKTPRGPLNRTVPAKSLYYAIKIKFLYPRS